MKYSHEIPRRDRWEAHGIAKFSPLVAHSVRLGNLVVGPGWPRRTWRVSSTAAAGIGWQEAEGIPDAAWHPSNWHHGILLRAPLDTLREGIGGDNQTGCRTRYAAAACAIGSAVLMTRLWLDDPPPEPVAPPEGIAEAASLTNIEAIFRVGPHASQMSVGVADSRTKAFESLPELGEPLLQGLELLLQEHPGAQRI